MAVPKILYHGTSRARWETGIKQVGLVGIMPRAMLIDYKHYGYVFLTDSVQDAAFYSPLTLKIDDKFPKLKALNEATGNQGMVLYIQTSDLKDVEHDPERDKTLEFYKARGVLEDVKKAGLCANWYRILGRIPRKHIHPYMDVPSNKQNPILMQILTDYLEVDMAI